MIKKNGMFVKKKKKQFSDKKNGTFVEKKILIFFFQKE